MRVAATIELNESERRSKTASVHLARRAQMVLLVAQGLHNDAIARRLGVGRVQVGRWRSRYLRNSQMLCTPIGSGGDLLRVFFRYLHSVLERNTGDDLGDPFTAPQLQPMLFGVL